MRREPHPGLAQTTPARTAPPPTSASPTVLVRSGGRVWGQAWRANRAGACAPLGCCARLCAPVCVRVPAYACACLRRRGRVCEGAGVFAAPLPACAPGLGRLALVADAHRHGQPGPAWQGSPMRQRTGISAGSGLRASLESLTMETHPQTSAKKPPTLASSTSLFCPPLRSWLGQVWGGANRGEQPFSELPVFGVFFKSPKQKDFESHLLLSAQLELHMNVSRCRVDHLSRS